MIPADKNHVDPFAKKVPEVTETQQCPNCDLPQPERVEPEIPVETGSETSIKAAPMPAGHPLDPAPTPGQARTPRTSQDSPEAGKMPHHIECNCPWPQPEEAGPEMPEEKVEQEETPEAVETQQCPNCNLLQLEEEPVPKLELYCACKPVAVDHGIPVGPDQVLAQYNSRPPILNTNQGRPVSTAPTPITNPGRPVYATPIMRPNPAQPVYVAPRPINKCSKCHTYAGPVPVSPVHAAPKR